MAKKTADPPIDWAALKFAGKTFAFGRVDDWLKARYRQVIEAEGGHLVDALTEKTDFLLLQERDANKPSPLERKAEQLNAKKGAAILALDRREFYARMAPTRDEALAMLLAGQEGAQRWNALRCANADEYAEVPMPNVGAVDFRKAALRDVCFYKVDVDGSDFRGADLTKAHLGEVKNAKFDGATLSGAWFSGLVDCSLKNANFCKAGASGVQRCDFSGAKMEGSFFGKAGIRDTLFRRANLKRSKFDEVKVSGCDFSSADLSEARLTKCELRGANFAGAKLEKAVLEKSDLSEAKLTRARLAGADLSKAKLARADLTGADLRGAHLPGADLTDALVDGADFTGANLIGAKLPAALDKAKGLEQARRVGGKAGPHLHELSEVAASAKFTHTTIAIEIGDNRALVEATQRREKSGKYETSGSWSHFVPTAAPYDYDHAASLSAAMLMVGHKFAGATLWLDTLTVTCDRKPRGKDLWVMAASAWCEAFGVEVPAPEALEQQRQFGPQRQQQLQQRYLAELRGGPAGLEAWNQRARSNELEKLCKVFPDADLTGAKIAEAYFYRLQFPCARLDGADARKMRADNCSFRGASFRNTNLEGCRWYAVTCEGADFTGAILRGGYFRSGSFQNANLSGADLRGANFEYATFVGTDLSRARLDGATFEGARYDEQTRFPAGLLPEGMRYVGEGDNPHLKKLAEAPPPAEKMDVATFLQRLRGNVESGRVDNALKMLKAERFELFAQVEPQHLVGIIKSQSSASRLYSCRLSADGTFSCCTQNLLPCGGLGGSVCKHLLVLIVGLVKSGQVDAARIDRWVSASRKQRPALDKEVMSATFLRYKGAEAGEIDWRPTETIPEDYYAL